MKSSICRLMIIYILLTMLASYIPADAASVEHKFFTDTAIDKIVSWSGGSGTVDSQMKKEGSSAFRVTISKGSWNGTRLEKEKAIAIDKDKLSSTMLKFWVRLPKGTGTPNVFLHTFTDGKSVETQLSLGKYIAAEEKGKWKYIQIPLSSFSDIGQAWNSETQQNETATTNFGNIKSIGFKMDGTSLEKAYIFYVDEVSISDSYDPNDTTEVISASLSVAMVKPVVKTESDGIRVYMTLFDDEIIKTKSGIWHNGRYELDRRDRKVGDASLKVIYQPYPGYQGASFNMNNPVAFNLDLVEKTALDLWVKLPSLSSVSLRLSISNADGTTMDMGINLRNYVYSDEVGEWKHITVPLKDLPKYGTYWDSESASNISVPADWNCINGFGFNLDTSRMKEAYEIKVDNIRIIEYTGREDGREEVSVKLVEAEEYESIQQNFTMIDMKAQANRHFRDETAYDGKGGWIDQGKDDLRGFTLKGVNKFLGVPFHIIDPDENDGKACIVTRGQNREAFPLSVEIPVGGKTAAGVYFLHSAAWVTTNVGEYIVKYTDGTRERIPLVDGININDWGEEFISNVARTAYRCWNDNGKNGGFAVFAWANPYPSKEIDSITVSTPGDASFIMLAGITLTDSGPYLPLAEDIKIYHQEDINPDTTNWFPYELPDVEKLKGSPLDASWLLEAPAGKRGYVKAEGDRLVFEDGTEARFWGVNIVAEANFLSKEDADMLVDRIAASGYNLARFHHLDADWARPNIFGNPSADTSELDPVRLDQFEYLWAKCKERGIYLYVDGLCYRMGGMKSQAKFREDLQQKQKEFYKNLFTHINPYTGTSLAEDPALVMVDIINEDSLFWRESLAWGFHNETNKSNIEVKFAAWLREKYETMENLKAAWNVEGYDGVGENDSLDGRVSINIYYHLDVTKTSPQKLKDIQYFFYEIEQKYYYEMKRYLKEEIGLKCLITGSNSPADNYQDVYSLASFEPDFIDQHAYFTHPIGSQWNLFSGLKMKNAAESMLNYEGKNMVMHLASERIAGFPYANSEWNQCEPNIYSAESIPIMAAYASLHNWHPMFFAYLQGGLRKTATLGHILNMYEVPTKIAISPASSIMFLRHDIKEAETGYYEQIRLDNVMSSVEYETDIPREMSMVAKTGVILPDIPNPPVDLSYSNEGLLEYIESQRKEGKYVAVNGQMRWDSILGTLEINSSNTQGYIGFIGGTTGVFDNMDVMVDNHHAIIMLTSLSREDIENSEKLLLSAVGRWRNSGMEFSEDASTLTTAGHPPMLVEPITGKITIKTNNTYDVYYLSVSGERMGKAETVENADGSTTIILSADYQTMNYELVKTGEKEAKEFRRPTWGKNLQIPVNQFGFKDMQNHWAKTVVNAMLAEGILEEGEIFGPDCEVTVHELEKWLQNASCAISLGNSEYVTREMLFVEAAKLLHNNRSLDYSKQYRDFVDSSDISEYAEEYINVLAGNGLISGDQNNQVRPKDRMTRAEAAVFVNKVISQLR